MKPTKKQIWSVKETIKHWSWLKNNPSKAKESYPPIKRALDSGKINGKHIVFADCYLCDCFDCDDGVGFKRKCPLNSDSLRCGDANGNPFNTDDYSKPLEVRWLCCQHHFEHHKELKEAKCY